jgi:hypothetical protein
LHPVACNDYAHVKPCSTFDPFTHYIGAVSYNNERIKYANANANTADTSIVWGPPHMYVSDRVHTSVPIGTGNITANNALAASCM